MEDAITVNIARKRLAAVIDGCLTGDMSRTRSTRSSWRSCTRPTSAASGGVRALRPLRKLAIRPQPPGMETLMEERCPSCGQYGW